AHVTHAHRMNPIVLPPSRHDISLSYQLPVRAVDRLYSRDWPVVAVYDRRYSYNHLMQTNGLRHDWTWEEVQALYNRPMLDAVFAAQAIHRQYFPDSAVQLCQLLSVKTGG